MIRNDFFPLTVPSSCFYLFLSSFHCRFHDIHIASIDASLGSIADHSRFPLILFHVPFSGCFVVPLLSLLPERVRGLGRGVLLLRKWVGRARGLSGSGGVGAAVGKLPRLLRLGAVRKRRLLRRLLRVVFRVSGRLGVGGRVVSHLQLFNLLKQFCSV
jgi:hypothetical protein